MTNYHHPLTFEQKIDVVLEGIFLNTETRKDILNKIIDEVKHEIKLHKLSTDIGVIQNIVILVLYRRIMR